MHKKQLTKFFMQVSPRKAQFCVTWILGLLLGALLAAGSEPSFAWMRLAAQQQVSIVFFWILAVFPFLIVAYAVTVKRQEILLVAGFCQTFLTSYLWIILHRLLGSAAWLLEPMLLLSHNLCFPLLSWFILRHMDGKKDTLVRDHILCLSIAFIFTTFQHLAVTPYLWKLIFIS